MAAVVDQLCSDGRVHFARQLGECTACAGSVLAEDDALIDRVARTQLLDGLGHTALVGRLRRAGEAVAITCKGQCHACTAIGQVAVQEGVVIGHRAELTLNAAGRLQHVELLTEHAAGLVAAEQCGVVVFQGQGHVGAAHGGGAADHDTVAGGGREFNRVGRARCQVEVARHLQRADGVARRDGAALIGGQRRDAAIAAQYAAVVDGDRRGQRAVDRQASLIDQRRAAVAVGASQHQGADALFGQAAVAGDVVAPHVEPALRPAAGALGRFAGIDNRTDTRQVSHELAVAVGAVDTELGRNVRFGDEHAWAVDRLAEVDHAPAVQRIDTRCAKIGGGGFQDVGDLRAGHVRKALHQHSHAACDVRRGHRGAVLVGPADGQVCQAGAVEDRTIDARTGCRDAEAGGVAAT